MRKSGASHETWLQSWAPSWDCRHTSSSHLVMMFCAGIETLTKTPRYLISGLTYTPRTTCLGMTPPTVVQSLPDESLSKKMPYRFPYRPLLWRHFLSWGFPFQKTGASVKLTRISPEHSLSSLGQLLTILLPPLKCWDYRHVSPHPVCRVVGIELKASCMITELHPKPP
jgi:hypothetical protein